MRMPSHYPINELRMNRKLPNDCQITTSIFHGSVILIWALKNLIMRDKHFSMHETRGINCHLVLLRAFTKIENKSVAILPEHAKPQRQLMFN